MSGLAAECKGCECGGVLVGLRVAGPIQAAWRPLGHSCLVVTYGPAMACMSQARRLLGQGGMCMLGCWVGQCQGGQASVQQPVWVDGVGLW